MDSQYGPLESESNHPIADKLRNVVNSLYRIGPRNIKHMQNLTRAQVFLELALRKNHPHTYLQEYESKGMKFNNIVAEKTGSTIPHEILVIGAHYDSYKDSPGANNNASSLAVLLKLAEDYSHFEIARTVRFVCFVNEEEPFNKTKYMGSRVYAKKCNELGENIIGMICLETLGGRLFPDYENKLAVISNKQSQLMMAMVETGLKKYLKVENKVLSEYHLGKNCSDHWSFWKEGYTAVMITDPLSLKYPHYHTQEDIADRINYEWLTRVYAGIHSVIQKIIL